MKYQIILFAILVVSCLSNNLNEIYNDKYYANPMSKLILYPNGYQNFINEMNTIHNNLIEKLNAIFVK
jgi:hypothetical protein